MKPKPFMTSLLIVLGLAAATMSAFALLRLFPDLRRVPPSGQHPPMNAMASSMLTKPQPLAWHGHRKGTSLPQVEA